MVGKSRKEEEYKHLKNRREEQKIKKVMAQQATPTKNIPKSQGGRGVPAKNRGTNPPNILRKGPNCVLCKGPHWTKAHNFQIHGNFSHQHILDTLRQHKICFRCVLPFTQTHKFQNCSNPISQCEHCASFNHISLCCKNRKNAPLDLPRVSFDPKNQTHRGGQQEIVQID